MAADVTISGPEAADESAAEAVGAEHEAHRAALVPGRRRAHRVAELLDRRMRREQVGEDRDQHDDGDDREPDDRAPGLAEREPERAPGPGLGRDRGDGFDRVAGLSHGGSAG